MKKRIETAGGVYEIDDDSFNKTGKFSSLQVAHRVSDNQKVLIKHLKQSDVLGIDEHQKLIETILTNIHTLHPGIPQTFEVCRVGDESIIARQYIEGVDLKTLGREKKFRYFRTPDFAAKVGVAVCDILDAIHVQGIIHRDVKPANIMVKFQAGKNVPDYYKPEVYLIDFELSQLRGASIFALDKTPFAMVYSAPEQLLRYQHLIDARSDTFSLAVTLYEFLAGKPAFHHQNPELLLNLQLNHPLVKHVRIPHELFAIMHKASQKQAFQLPPNRYSYDEKELILMKGKENRFASAAEMKAALEGFLMKYEAIPPANNIFGKIRAFFR